MGKLTLEFKLKAVRLVESDQAIAEAARMQEWPSQPCLRERSTIL